MDSSFPPSLNDIDFRIPLPGVREYNEGLEVEVVSVEGPRLAVKAYNEGGCCATSIDLLDLLGALSKEFPHLLTFTPPESL